MSRPQEDWPEFIASFPMIHSDIPCGAFLLPNLVEHLKNNPPHWFYHLAALQGQEADPPFTTPRPGWLSRLTELLGLPPRAWQFRALEMVFNPERAPGVAPDLAFPIDQTFDGGSWMLSVAVLLASAAAGVRLPPWVVCSGCLHDPLDSDLALTETGEIKRKLQPS
jgi:hypothetical protein